jgi:hypothetical protein
VPPEGLEVGFLRHIGPEFCPVFIILRGRNFERLSNVIERGKHYELDKSGFGNFQSRRLTNKWKGTLSKQLPENNASSLSPLLRKGIQNLKDAIWDVL